MAKNEIEIIPPSRPLARMKGAERQAGSALRPTNPGGPISSALMRWEANRHSRVFNALAEATRQKAGLVDAHTELIESQIKHARALYRLDELDEILAADRARRRIERFEEVRDAQHRRDLNERHRMRDVAIAEAALVDAQQALQAQRDHGYIVHELNWKRQRAEVLGVELDAAERRALLREAEQPRDSSEGTQSVEKLIEQLYTRREELRADGLDTSRIDDALAQVQKQ